MAKLPRAQRQVQDPTGVSGAKVQADLQAPAATQRLGQTIATAGPEIADAVQRRQDVGNKLAFAKLDSKINRSMTASYTKKASLRGDKAAGIVQAFNDDYKALMDNDETLLDENGNPVSSAVREQVIIASLKRLDSYSNDLAGRESVQTTVAIGNQIAELGTNANESLQANPSFSNYVFQKEEWRKSFRLLSDNEMSGHDEKTAKVAEEQGINDMTETFIQNIAASGLTEAEGMEGLLKSGEFDEDLTVEGKKTIEAEVKRLQSQHKSKIKEAEQVHISDTQNDWLIKWNDGELTIPDIEKSDMPPNVKLAWDGRLKASTKARAAGEIDRFKSSNPRTYAQWVTGIMGDRIDKTNIEELIQDIYDQIGNTGPNWLSTTDAINLSERLRNEAANRRKGIPTPKADNLIYNKMEVDYKNGVFGDVESDEAMREYGNVVRDMEVWRSQNKDGDFDAQYAKITKTGRDRNFLDSALAWWWGVDDDKGFASTPHKNRILLREGVDPVNKDAFEAFFIERFKEANKDATAEEALNFLYESE